MFIVLPAWQDVVVRQESDAGSASFAEWIQLQRRAAAQFQAQNLPLAFGLPWDVQGKVLQMWPIFFVFFSI